MSPKSEKIKEHGFTRSHAHSLTQQILTGAYSGASSILGTEEARIKTQPLHLKSSQSGGKVRQVHKPPHCRMIRAVGDECAETARHRDDFICGLRL